MTWDAFLSHASEDKDKVARPLYKVLTNLGKKIWFDEFTLKIGDDLRDKIDEGLSESTFGIVIISKKFFEKNWTKEELGALESKATITGKKVILPVWYKITKEEVLKYSPLLSKLHALNFNEGINVIAKKIAEEISPMNDNNETTHSTENMENEEILSHVQLYKQRVIKDFKNYPTSAKLNEYNPIVKGFRNFNGHKEYVSQSFIDENKKQENDILDYLLKELKIGQKKFTLIVGGYGSGKTSLCHYVLYEICKNEEDDLIPIFIPFGNLRKFDEKITFEDLSTEIYNFITKEYNFNLEPNDFNNFVNDGKFLFILDALDELAQKINKEVINTHLDRIRVFEQKGNTVVLTSRQTYFSGQREEQLLKEKSSIQILDFDQEQIETFIHRKSHKDESFFTIMNNIIHNKRFIEIIKKPLFLNVICERYNEVNKYSIINPGIIMKILTDHWLTHDIKKNDNIEEYDKVMQERRRITEILALYETRHGRPIPKNDLELQIKNEISKDSEEAKHALEKYYMHAQNSTFLVREENDTFKFILKLIVEYFVATKLVDYIINDNRNMILSICEKISSETINFINDMFELEWWISDILFGEIQYNDRLPKEIIEFLKHKRNMATNIYNAIDLSRTYENKPNICQLIEILRVTKNIDPTFKYNDLNLYSLDGNYLKLQNTEFNNSNLRTATLNNATLESSKFNGANMSNTIRFFRFRYK